MEFNVTYVVAKRIIKQDQYVKNKAFDDQYYKDLIVKYLEQYGSAKKKDIRTLLWDKLPEIMEDKQKEDKGVKSKFVCKFIFQLY